LTPVVPTTGVCKLVFVAFVGVFVEELAELFELWRDHQEPFDEEVEPVGVVEAVDVLAKLFDLREARRGVVGLLVPVADEELGVK
jgi:hypothetical protein